MAPATPLLPTATLLGALTILGGCAAGPRQPLDELLAEASSAAPARLWIEGDRIVAAAVPTGPGSLPAAVRTAIDSIAPGGERLFAGREYGPDGDGYRVDVRYVEDAAESFRSALLNADGAVLQRSHSVPLHRVPSEVLAIAMRTGREVMRCEIVSDDASERGWRVLVRDGVGREWTVAIDLTGNAVATQRIVDAQLWVRRAN